MFLTRVDFWIGRTLFVPPIILFCRLTHQSQYAVSRLFWFFAALDGFYQSPNLVSLVIFGTLSIFMMLTAALRADMPVFSVISVRLLAMAALLIFVGIGIVDGEWGGIEFWVLVLIAEYAATIKTLPPKEDKRAPGSADAKAPR